MAEDRDRRLARIWYGAALREHLPLVAGGVVALVVGAAILVFSTSGVIAVGGGERSLAERDELLSDGDCVVRDGQALGRIEGVLGPSRGNPKGRYQVALLDEHRVLQVHVDEVEIVECATLAGR